MQCSQLICYTHLREQLNNHLQQRNYTVNTLHCNKRYFINRSKNDSSYRLEPKNKGSENAASIKILLVKTVKEIRHDLLPLQLNYVTYKEWISITPLYTFTLPSVTIRNPGFALKQHRCYAQFR